MMKRTGRLLLIALGIFISTMVCSSPGDLFAITGTGRVATIDIQLCLNGNTPWSCEKHTVTREILSIRTTVPN